jgi:hypothetical protein
LRPFFVGSAWLLTSLSLCRSNLVLADEFTNQWPEEQQQGERSNTAYQVVREENI